MGKGSVRCYRDDDILKPILDEYKKKRQESEVVRKALYEYFFKGTRQPEDFDPISILLPFQISKSIIKTEDKVVDLPPVKEFKFGMFDD